jgi:hypothetical protein
MRLVAIPCATAAVGILLFSASGCGSSGGAGGTGPTVTNVDPNSGLASGGTAVIITGTNFEDGATVKFGSVAATFVGFNSPTSLSASTPAGSAGAVGVTVTNPDGQSATLPGGFTYISTACEVPATVTTSTTLDTSCVWTVLQTVIVGGTGNPVLTILPGTTLIFARGAALRVGADGNPGGLVANGTGTDEDEAIVFTSAAGTPAAGDWGGVLIGPEAISPTSIEYATINYAGGSGANDLPDTAALTVEGGDVTGGNASSAPTPVLLQLTLNNSAGHGLVFAGLNAGFGAGSGSLTVTNWEMSRHYPYVIEANQGGTVPTSITAPATPPTSTAVVAFNSYGNIYSSVVVTQTWPSLPLPILSLLDIELAAAASDPAARLTIAAPNTLEFAPGTTLDVDPDGNGSGFLVANGTDDTTGAIVFTSNASSPSPGAWGGINFEVYSGGQGSSSLTHALIQYANNTELGPPPGYGTGAVLVSNATGVSSALTGPVIANCRFESYPSFAIVLVDVTSSTYSDYLADNTFGTPGMTVSSFCSESGEPNCTDTGP